MPDMMLTEARFGMGRVVTQTVGVIRRNAGPIILLCCIVYMISTVGSYLIGSTIIKLIPGQQFWLSAAINSAPQAWLLGSVTYIAVEDIDGRRARLGPAMLVGVRLMIPVFLLNLLVNLSAVVGSLLIVPGVMLLMRWFVAAPVRVIEGPGFRNVLSRSAALTKGHRWKLLGLSVAYGMLASISYLPAVLIGVFAGQTMRMAGFSTGIVLLSLVLSVVRSAIVTAGTAVIYTELRRVKEGGLPNQLAAVFE